MAKKAKGSSRAPEYQFTAPSESDAKECAESLGLVARGVNRLKRTKNDVDSANVIPLKTVARIAASWLLAAVATFPSVQGKQLLTMVKNAKRAFNEAILPRLTESGQKAAKNTLSKIHRVVLHPATTQVFGQLWAKGEYGATIPSVDGDGESEATMAEGTKRCAASDRPNTPQAVAERWLTNQAKRAASKRDYYAMISAVVENLLASEVPPVQQVAQG